MSRTATPTATATDTVLFGMQAGDCRTQIANTMKQHGDTVLFYFEHASCYRCVIPINAAMYKPCLRMLGCFARRGDVLSVSTDGDAPVHFPGGVQLWPIFVELKDVPCVENLVITGGPGEMTPYMFANKANRDQVLAWLRAKLGA